MSIVMVIHKQDYDRLSRSEIRALAEIRAAIDHARIEHGEPTLLESQIGDSMNYSRNQRLQAYERFIRKQGIDPDDVVRAGGRVKPEKASRLSKSMTVREANKAMADMTREQAEAFTAGDTRKSLKLPVG